VLTGIITFVVVGGMHLSVFLYKVPQRDDSIKIVTAD
jgi:hypothetical protein